MTERLPTNFEALGRSNRMPKNGDLFTLKLVSRQFLFGRVIRADADRLTAPGPACNLIQIYDRQSEDERPPVDALSPESLLIPPLWTNRKAWTLGYFKTIASLPLLPADCLSPYCFEDTLPTFGTKYRDEEGGVLPDRLEPCGIWGLVSYRWVDDRISEALGVPKSVAHSSDFG
jgi:hypothetical protein